jgi:hypothetical protein
LLVVVQLNVQFCAGTMIEEIGHGSNSNVVPVAIGWKPSRDGDLIGPST